MFLCWLENVHPSDTSFWIEIRPVMSCHPHNGLLKFSLFGDCAMHNWKTTLYTESSTLLVRPAVRTLPVPLHLLCESHLWCQFLTLLLMCSLSCKLSLLSVTCCQTCPCFGTVQLDKARDQTEKIKEEEALRDKNCRNS